MSSIQVLVKDNAEHILDRVTNNMEIDPITGCFGFLGCITNNGYGQIRIKDKVVYVHRAIYMLLVGEIPEGFDIDHICQETDCFNPDHLQALSKSDHRKVSHKRLNSDTHFRCGHLKISVNIAYNQRSYDGIKCRICKNERQREYRYLRKAGRGGSIV